MFALAMSVSTIRFLGGDIVNTGGVGYDDVGGSHAHTWPRAGRASIGCVVVIAGMVYESGYELRRSV